MDIVLDESHFLLIDQTLIVSVVADATWFDSHISINNVGEGPENITGRSDQG